MKRLGVIGTMVWDTIYGRGIDAEPVEEWGGIAYALAAFEAALPHDWAIVPLVKVGRDLASEANRFLESLSRRSGAHRFVEVPAPNNRVTLRYESAQRRCEQLSGGVPPWTWEELGPMVRDLDAVYVNFISGFEMTLETATYLRHGFQGPIYADLHSLLLGVRSDGIRFPQPLDQAPAWFACFDSVQLNEDEMGQLGPEPIDVAARMLAAGVRLLVVTVGERGAIYFTEGDFVFTAVRGEGTSPHPPGAIRTGRVPTEQPREVADPTGCGDVFGATLTALLLRGESLEPAIHHANAMATRNAQHRGATNLHYYLRGEIAPQ